MDKLTVLLGENATILGIHVHIWVLVLIGMAVIAALGLFQHSQ
ncbi:MAG TPA: hypothetical protein VFB31_10280 [Pseudolabrys sp.]|nr:hypothetical protein [Pseudolabrys sp.]